MKLFGRSRTQDQPQDMTSLEAISIVEESVEKLPWFGEDPFLASQDKRPPRRAQDDIPYIRRILISWLIGRPVSQIARRAGCSSRLVHKVINGFFYGEPEVLNWHFRQWFDLGLIAAIETPRTDPGYEETDAWPSWFSPGCVSIACLICHRIVGGLPYDENDGSGEEMRDVSPMLERLMFIDRDELKHGAMIQGHLLCHFALDYDPIMQPRRSVRMELLSIKSMLGNASPADKRSLVAMKATRKRSRYRTTSPWATNVLDDFLSGETGPLLPVEDGKQLGLEQARRRWRKMM